MFRSPPARGRPRHPSLDIRADAATHGRGAVGNPTGRYESAERIDTWDGWAPDPEETPQPVRTVVGVDATRTIIARNDSPDVGFDRSINPYRGCEHGCIYCFARPSHAYLGLSPGLDFETRLFHKPDAAMLLRRELSRPSYKPAPIALGVNTDAYQPVERRLGTTRAILEVLHEFRHPVGLITKSVLIQRDVDILAPMAALNLCRVTLSVTTLDRDLARVMEPRASAPGRRLDAIRGLARAGIPVQINVAPIIPGLNDHEIEALIEAGAAAGATSVGWTMLRLPLELATMFEDWLHAHRPDRAARILSLIRQVRGGRLNDPTFGGRMRGEGPYAALMAARVRAARKRYGMVGESDAWGRLDSSLFRVPTAQGDLFAS